MSDDERYQFFIQRVNEILKERKKKPAYLVGKVDITRDTVYRILNGKRGMATLQEKREIAAALGLTLERIMQEDVADLLDELECLLSRGNDVNRTIILSERWKSIALGKIERLKALTKLGRAYYLGQRYEDAHDVWVEAFAIASSDGVDEEALFDATINLIESYFSKGNFEKVLCVLNDIEVKYIHDYEKMGYIYQYRGLCCVKKNELEEAKKKFLESYKWFSQAGIKIMIGRVQHNLANIEYDLENFERSKIWFLESINNLQEDTLLMQSIVEKDLARTLICLDENDTAISLIENRISILQDYRHVYPSLIGKLLLMKSDICRDVGSALDIFQLNQCSREILCNAADLLTDLFFEQKDYDSAKKYYKIMKDNAGSCIPNYKKGGWF